MRGLDGRRVYLDWNATAPLRPEARAAMLEAEQAFGNPSSVHAEGRAAKMIVERARGQVAGLVECDPDEVVFTSGATEAVAMAAHGGKLFGSSIEHDCVHSLRSWDEEQYVGPTGLMEPEDPPHDFDIYEDLVAFQGANSETGVVHDYARTVAFYDATLAFRVLVDMAQILGKVPVKYRPNGQSGNTVWAPLFRAVSGHKFGGPKGVGALIVDHGYHGTSGYRGLSPMLVGGGQEKGRRSGTENVIGIAGFGAAAEAAQRDLNSGIWEDVEKIRNILEERLESAAPDLIVVGKEAPRLPNTSCFTVPGWKGETQVMQMDLAGFAISAGSACSSGKVKKASRVLLAMGFDEDAASSAVRVSMGPTTTEAEVMAFADAWIEHYRKRKARAA